jgi:hypothetical protein
MNTNHTIKKKPQSMSMIEWITQYESLVVFGGFGCAVLLVIILTGIFQAGPVVRDNVLYNSIGAIAMGIGFIYVIFNFMGRQVIIFGTPIDVGMVLYVAIVLFIMFVLGN